MAASKGNISIVDSVGANNMFMAPITANAITSITGALASISLSATSVDKLGKPLFHTQDYILKNGGLPANPLSAMNNIINLRNNSLASLDKSTNPLTTVTFTAKPASNTAKAYVVQISTRAFGMKHVVQLMNLAAPNHINVSSSKAANGTDVKTKRAKHDPVVLGTSNGVKIIDIPGELANGTIVAHTVPTDNAQSNAIGAASAAASAAAKKSNFSLPFFKEHATAAPAPAPTKPTSTPAPVTVTVTPIQSPASVVQTGKPTNPVVAAAPTVAPTAAPASAPNTVMAVAPVTKSATPVVAVQPVPVPNTTPPAVKTPSGAIVQANQPAAPTSNAVVTNSVAVATVTPPEVKQVTAPVLQTVTTKDGSVTVVTSSNVTEHMMHHHMILKIILMILIIIIAIKMYGTYKRTGKIFGGLNDTLDEL
jgi:hypothetical protein